MYLVNKLVKEVRMGYPTKVQLINRTHNEQWYVNFPTALARAMEFERGEVVEWIIDDKEHLKLNRTRKQTKETKKKHRTD